MSVREAAERLLSYLDCTAIHFADYEGFDGDVQYIANRIVAEHPADEGEPITDAWLREIGFVDGNMPGDLTSSPIVRGISTRSGEYWVVRSYPLPYVPKTRGQLRKLLEALGVETKGGGK